MEKQQYDLSAIATHSDRIWTQAYNFLNHYYFLFELG